MAVAEEGPTMKIAKGSGEVTIRTARSNDAASIATLATELGYPSTEADIQTRLERIKTRTEGAAIVADLSGNGVCGWIVVISVISLTGPARLEIAGLVVDPKLRGLGIGAHLLQAAESWAHINGYADLRVRSNVIRERAHQFYEREGFARNKTQVLFCKTT